jgi:hypothetical protein
MQTNDLIIKGEKLYQRHFYNDLNNLIVAKFEQSKQDNDIDFFIFGKMNNIILGQRQKYFSIWNYTNKLNNYLLKTKRIKTKINFISYNNEKNLQGINSNWFISELEIDLLSNKDFYILLATSVILC